MNPELQAQTDQFLKAIAHLEHTAHQDELILFAFLTALLIVSIIGLFRK